MKALTLRQPWASLVALGHKRVENRGRNVTHRGPLAIHAGKQTDPAGFALAEQLGIQLPDDLPAGAIVAVTDLADCVAYDPDEPALFADPYDLAADPFATGPRCLILRHTRALAEPIPYRGQQSLFAVPEEFFNE